MIKPKILDFYKRLLMASGSVGNIVRSSVDERHISIDIADGDTTYLLTVMTATMGGQEDAD